MVDRTDGWSVSRPKGTGIWTFGGPLTIGGTYPILTERSVRSDSYGAVPDNGPFHVEYFKLTGGTINGRQPDSTNWSNYIADLYESAPSFGHRIPADAPDVLSAATMGAARTTPSRPSADIPANILELGTLGQMMRAAPKTLRDMWASGIPHPIANLTHFAPTTAKEAASVNLYVKFGLVPILGDIVKCLKLKDLINQRVKELKRLHGNKGLRRTVTVYKGSRNDGGSAVMQSNFGFFGQDYFGNTTHEVRVHCRWRPAAGFLPWDNVDDDFETQARNAILGLSLTQLDTYWEAMPWSWMIDWMSTCGAYFRATRNIIPCDLPFISVMRHSKTEWHFFNGTRAGDAVLSDGRVDLESKDRVISPIFPTATLNFLTEDQMATVSSLAVQSL